MADALSCCCVGGHTSHSKINSPKAEWRDLCNKADLS